MNKATSGEKTEKVTSVILSVTAVTKSVISVILSVTAVTKSVISVISTVTGVTKTLHPLHQTPAVLGKKSFTMQWSAL